MQPVYNTEAPQIVPIPHSRPVANRPFAAAEVSQNRGPASKIERSGSTEVDVGALYQIQHRLSLLPQHEPYLEIGDNLA